MPEAALSLADELSKGFDDESAEPAVVDAPVADGGSPDVSATPEPSTEGDSGDGGRQRGPDGKFVKSSDSLDALVAKPAAEVGAGNDPAKPAEGQQAEAQTPESNVVDLPPSTFTPAAKAAYQALPKDSPLRADIKKREADYQKGISQYKQAAEQGSGLMAEIQPYMGMIQAEGGTPQRAIKQLLSTAYQLRSGTPQQRGQLVMQIAQQYGADLSQWTNRASTEAQPQGFDPQAIAPMVQQLLSPHLQRIEQFENQFLTAKQRQDQAEAQSANANIESFRTAAGKDGTPLHPYFDNVRDLMADFISAGHAKDMESAYAMACRAHPEVSQVVATEQARQQEAQRLAEAKRKAQDAARSAAVNATGQGGVGTADTTSKSLTDELSAAYDQMVGARL